MIKVFKKDETLSYFGKGRIKLSDSNLVYLSSPSIQIGKVLTFGAFKRNIYYYSELMTTPCVAELEAVEGRALMNARKGGKSRDNFLH